MIRKIFILLGALLSLFFIATSAMAHKINMFAYVQNGIVYTEVYFSDGRPVKNGEVEVSDDKGQTVLKGAVDEDGKFSFPIPVIEDLTIVINASMGHKDKLILKKIDLE